MPLLQYVSWLSRSSFLKINTLLSNPNSISTIFVFPLRIPDSVARTISSNEKDT